ncbi:hypothetical protein PIB30_115644, partial [Stylosanthes scabra]|nr:hypothetical protein [Stylosanthes scabra]
MNHPSDATSEGCMRIDALEMLIQEVQIEDSLLGLSEDLDDDVEEVEEISEGPISHDSEDEKHKQELKPLPLTLKYAFLGEDENFP